MVDISRVSSTKIYGRTLIIASMILVDVSSGIRAWSFSMASDSFLDVTLTLSIPLDSFVFSR